MQNCIWGAVVSGLILLWPGDAVPETAATVPAAAASTAAIEAKPATEWIGYEKLGIVSILMFVLILLDRRSSARETAERKERTELLHSIQHTNSSLVTKIDQTILILGEHTKALADIFHESLDCKKCPRVYPGQTSGKDQ